MFRLLIVSIIIAIILFILWKRSNSAGEIKKSNAYKNILLLLIVFVIVILIASQGKLILPKLFQLIKMILQFITKFIA